MSIGKVPFIGQYVRGQKSLVEIGRYCEPLGHKVFILGGKTALSKTQSSLEASLKKSGSEIVGTEWFGGECSLANVEALYKKALGKGADIIIAVGGGKTMDTGKLVAQKGMYPLITVPTIAATCAAVASVSVLYNEAGEFVDVVQLNRSPNVVIVDTEIISQAPVRWLAAGLGDTLAKWYEYRVSIEKAPKNGLTLGALANGKLCYDLIAQFGPLAKVGVEKGHHTEALDSAVDAIVLYAGLASLIGGTTVEAAAAHAFYNGLTIIPAAHEAGHGLTVGYGNLFQLALEGRSDEELLEAIQLADKCGVPTELKKLGPITLEDVDRAADKILSNSDMKNLPFLVNKEMVFNAIKRVDRLSESLK